VASWDGTQVSLRRDVCIGDQLVTKLADHE
jgi:hypothetical protein